MTLVFRTEIGKLRQTQLGPADVVATISLAQSVWGWVGGLDIVRNILNSFLGARSDEAARNLATEIPIGPAVCHIFTAHGSTVLSDDNTEQPFGGDFRTQLVGLSICALAHECGGDQAVNLFMENLAPALFKLNEGTEAIYQQLKDNRVKILNEGAARGLTRVFEAAISRLNLPSWNGHEGSDVIDDGFVLTDMNYVVSFLQWLVQEERDKYFTRSNVVARVAACLREVGYFIGQIETWDGSGDVPRSHRSNAVVLVTGGSSETDPFVDPRSSVPHGDFVYHYQFNTVGAMLSNALKNRHDIPPEVFQTIFEQTYSYIEAHLHFRWEATTTRDQERYYGPAGSSRIHNMGICSMQVKAEWTQRRLRPSSISIRLASLDFPLSAELIAPCYEPISNPESLNLILDKKTAYIEGKFPRDLAIFRAITTSVVLATAGRLAEKDFKTMQHSICIDLVGGSWLGTLCPILDESFSAKLDLGRAVFTLAAVHAGCPDTLADHRDVKDELVGWRNGIYAVVPSVLLEMAPTPEAIGIRCYEGFWANTVARNSGAIVSNPNRTLYMDSSIVRQTESEMSSLQSLAGPYIAPPACGPPDVSLYLNIERSTYTDEPEICFCGRIGGTSVGTASIKEVMNTLVRCFEEQEECPGHPARLSVVNVKASMWAAKKFYKPVGQWDKHHTFIPVQNDPSWALFLAGQSSSFDGRIVRSCVDCTAQKMLDGSILVGYS